MNIGVHVSSAGDLSLAPLRAQEIGCECFQIFSRPPQGGPAKPISDELAENYKANCKKFKLPSYVHTPYYINLASLDNRIYHGSISVIREELERSSKLGAKYLMTHLGSAKDQTREEAMAKVTEGIFQILKDYQGSTEFLMEISAGSGNIIGDSFDEMAEILDQPKLKGLKISICFDTCHAFASGYDLRDEKTVKATFAKFNKLIGLKKLKLMHVNDSMTDLNSKKDHHEHIGKGKIGLKGFKAIVALAEKNKIDLILETQHDEYLDNDIKILKKFRNSAKK